MPQTSVSASPTLKGEVPLSETRPMPNTHMNAAMIFAAFGRRLKNAQTMNGTSTQ